MNLKPYKNLIPERHHIKYAFLERNASFILSLVLLLGTAIAVYYTFQ